MVFRPLPAHDEHTMPGEHFETMGIAAGPDSGSESGRWHGDRGEVMCLRDAHRERQDRMVLPGRRDGTDRMPCRRPKAPQAGVDQAHQYKHFAQVRLPAERWQNWVFHISDSKRRRTRSLFRPPQTEVCGLSCWQPGGIDLPARLFVGCGLNSRQINHLQHVASETHYRGQTAGASASGQHVAGR